MKLKKFEVEEIWSWRNLKLKKFEVEEIWNWRNLKLKKFEIEEICSWILGWNWVKSFCWGPVILIYRLTFVSTVQLCWKLYSPGWLGGWISWKCNLLNPQLKLELGLGLSLAIRFRKPLRVFVAASVYREIRALEFLVITHIPHFSFELLRGQTWALKFQIVLVKYSFKRNCQKGIRQDNNMIQLQK